ncbi:hypothetical protein Tco_0042387, partial [Tanacetum coccineum]
NVNVQGAGNDDVNVLLLQLTRGRVVPLAAEPKRLRKKRKVVDGVSSSGLPPKKLREDHGVSRDASAGTAEKSLVVLQGLLDRSTLATEIGATSAATIPFVTSSVTPSPEREGGGHGDSITGLSLRTQLASERFVILTDSSHHSSIHAAADEVTSIVRSSMPPPPVLTAVVATTIIADVTSASAPRVGTRQVPPTLHGFIFLSQDVDSETLHHIYIPKWNVTNDSTLDDPDICHDVIDHLAPPTFFPSSIAWIMNSYLLNLMLDELRGRKKFGDKYVMQAGWLKERDAEIASLKAQLSLKEAEAAKAIRLHSQVFVVEAMEAARASELNGLKER